LEPQNRTLTIETRKCLFLLYFNQDYKKTTKAVKIVVKMIGWSLIKSMKINKKILLGAFAAGQG